MVLIAEGVAQVFEKDGAVKAANGHGYTYSDCPVGAAAALACLVKTRRLNVPENATVRGQELYGGLLALHKRIST